MSCYVSTRAQWLQKIWWCWQKPHLCVGAMCHASCRCQGIVYHKCHPWYKLLWCWMGPLTVKLVRDRAVSTCLFSDWWVTVPSGTLALALPRPSKEAGAGDVKPLALNALPAPVAGALALCLPALCVPYGLGICRHCCSLSHLLRDTSSCLRQCWLLIVLYPLYSSTFDPPGTFSTFDSSLNCIWAFLTRRL